ncbi:MAG TPA: dienelactone hydrolase family protein [Anaerolineales bacterium]
MNEIRRGMVEFPVNGAVAPAFLAQPGQAGHYPGLVLIQEWWGLVPHIKDVAERFARHGFVALAPDLYHGQAASEPDEARKLAMEMDRERAVQEIVAAVRYVQGLESVSPKKIGVVGWCMGGGLAITAAASSSELGAAVAFYGMPRDISQAQQIQAPLLGLYAEHDHGITPEMLKSFEQELEKQGVLHEIHTYPGTQHAFFNDTRAHIYDPQAAQDAWGRTLEWFRKYLK